MKRPESLSVFTRFSFGFDQWPKPLLYGVCAALIILIGWITNQSGPGISASLLFLLPVLLVARVSGLRGGLLAAAAAAGAWFIADRHTGDSRLPDFADYWNLAMRLGTFSVAVVLVSAMRELNAKLESRVADRTAQLEAQTRRQQELERKLLEVADSEQVKLGQDLHDGLCQQLAAMSFSANLLREMIGEADRGLVSQAERLSLDVDNAITQARDLAKGLYPARLEREGLAPALLELAANIESRFAIRCETRLDPVPAWIPPAAMIHLYRIAQEAIVNAAKHSGGSRIHVALGSDHSGAVSLQVKDDGKGMDSHRSSDGMGLSIMEHRTRLIGAELVIRSEPGKGLSVNCRLPYDSLSSRT